MSTVDPSVLAQEWAKQLIDIEEKIPQAFDSVVRATGRSIPLLEDASSVPFVCRYRTDLIEPLTNRQIHLLCSLVSKHDSLASLRTKLLSVVKGDDPVLVRRIETSTSKSELEDLYAPFKPPSKGSILERIQKEHPRLVEQVEALWTGTGGDLPSAKSFKPRDALVHLIATKIAAEPAIIDIVIEELRKHCRVKTSIQKPESKFSNYDNFSMTLVHLRDHQVLAIRRGVTLKVVKMGYEIDGTKTMGTIKWKFKQLFPWAGSSYEWRSVVDDAVQDAWSRLLRRRGTSRLWSEKCKEAEERAMQVFEENLHHALLAPPLPAACPLLALDPGYQAGIKCAVLDSNGNVLRLETVKFLGNNREHGLKTLGSLLSFTKGITEANSKVVVSLGNGHGSQDARVLAEEASRSESIDIDIRLVSEAGASVWSVTEAAKDEFPNEPAAAIASISIGRRLQNPLHELIKVPPRSLGLGMYQHDLSEKELDEKLHLTSVDAVATVGVDANACSVEILQKVPGLKKLAAGIIKARPLRQRKDLLRISGLGPKTFENCAAFCRVHEGPEPLDGTLVHPESYDLARWLLKALHWNLSEAPKDLPPRKEWNSSWETILSEASEKFSVSFDRVLLVVENLVDSMTQIDPRLGGSEGMSAAATMSSTGSLEGCILLSGNLTSDKALQAACPVRGIIGTIRNIADFGAFVDFGGHNDGLVHTSNLGQVQLRSLLIGQQIGVDILSVTEGKVSLALSGLGITGNERSHGTKSKTPRRNFSSSAAKKNDRGKSSKRQNGSSNRGTAAKRSKVSR